MCRCSLEEYLQRNALNWIDRHDWAKRFTPESTLTEKDVATYEIQRCVDGSELLFA